MTESWDAVQQNLHLLYIQQAKHHSTNLFSQDLKFLLLTPTIPKALKKWNVEDTFWNNNKKLMPIKTTLAILDRHSVNVSVCLLRK